MTRKLPARPDPGRCDDPCVFLTPMLLLAAAISMGALVLALRDEPAEAVAARTRAEQTAAERLKCARKERVPCPTS